MDIKNEQQYNWDIKQIYPNINSLLSEIKKFGKIKEKIKKFKGIVTESPESMCVFFEFQEAYMRINDNLTKYINMRLTENQYDSKMIDIRKEYEYYGIENEKELEAIRYEIGHCKKLKDYINACPALDKYENEIEECKNERRDSRKFTNACAELYNARLGLEEIHTNLIGELAENNETGERFQSTIACLYDTYFNLANSYFKEKFNMTYLESINELYGFESDTIINIIKTLKEDNTIAKQLETLFERKPFISPGKKQVSVEKAKSIILKSSEVLGYQYQKELQKLLQGSNIDYFPSQRKSEEDLTYFCYNYGSFVSINYKNDFDSLLTLAHELGHAVQFNIKRKFVTCSSLETETCTTEIYSLLSELIVCDDMLKKAKTLDEKIKILNEMLKTYHNNLFSTSHEANLFIELNKSVEKRERLGPKLITKTNANIIKELNISTPKMSWVNMPSILEDMIQSKYIVGIIAASNIKKQLDEKTFSEKDYMEVVKHEGKYHPLEVLDMLNCPIEDEETTKQTLIQLKQLTETYQGLMDEKAQILKHRRQNGNRI